MSRELALECDYQREADCARKFQYVHTIAFNPSHLCVSVCVRNAGERLLNFRESGEMNAVPWDAAQGKSECLWPELSARITALSQPGVFSQLKT